MNKKDQLLLLHMPMHIKKTSKTFLVYISKTDSSAFVLNHNLTLTEFQNKHILSTIDLIVKGIYLTYYILLIYYITSFYFFRF